MKRKQVDVFEKLVGQLQSVYDEISLVSKKSPNDAVNKFKLGFINNMLTAANGFLGKQYKPFPEFEVFDVEAVPTNSDAVMMLGQYLQCFEKFRADNVEESYGVWYWKLDPSDEEDDDDDESGKNSVRTTRPKRLRE